MSRDANLANTILNTTGRKDPQLAQIAAGLQQKNEELVKVAEQLRNLHSDPSLILEVNQEVEDQRNKLAALVSKTLGRYEPGASPSKEAASASNEKPPPTNEPTLEALGPEKETNTAVGVQLDQFKTKTPSVKSKSSSRRSSRSNKGDIMALRQKIMDEGEMIKAEEELEDLEDQRLREEDQCLMEQRRREREINQKKRQLQSMRLESELRQAEARARAEDSDDSQELGSEEEEEEPTSQPPGFAPLTTKFESRAKFNTMPGLSSQFMLRARPRFTSQPTPASGMEPRNLQEPWARRVRSSDA